MVWLIFDKQTAQIYLRKSSKFLFDKVFWFQTEGNLIRFLTGESSESRTIDVSKQVESATLVGEIELREEAPLSDFLHREWGLFLGGGLLVVAIVWLIWRLTEVNFDEQKISVPEPEIDFSVQFS